MGTVPKAAPLTDAEYWRETGALLARIEAAADRWLQDDVIDVDASRTGGLLEMAFPNGSKIIVNTQPPLQEIWLAARGGGFHYRWSAGQWLDTRDSSEFLQVLSHHASLQGGKPLSF
jgi:CyaY protein